MKDLFSFFQKNPKATKMRRGFQNVCSNGASTSTLNQHNTPYLQENDLNAPPRKSVTLEEMIVQLEREEEIARREKAATCRHREEPNEAEEVGIMPDFHVHRRMSCVNNSDILRSARNALNQYPRFSLDGRDALYRSSFRNNLVGPAIDGLKLGRILHLPQTLGGESVIWCKPGLVPKLMGLEAMPIPIYRLNHYNNNNTQNKEKLRVSTRNPRAKRVEKNDPFEGRQRINARVHTRKHQVFGPK